MGYWEIVTSGYCLAEARMNLELKYPGTLGRLSEIILVLRLVPDVSGDRCGLSLPEKDRPVFAAAQRCKATHFLTGDRRHFGAYMNKPKETMGIIVQTVGDFFLDLMK
jgi:hypothetical protein